jgi:hypothetical protein
MTPAEFRRLALALPEAEERSHMNHPDFRVGGKIFATLSYPDESFGMVKLFPDQQSEFVTADPKTFAAVPGGWGRQGCTHILLKTANKEKVKEAMRAAWERLAPKPVPTADKASAKRRSSTKKDQG